MSETPDPADPTGPAGPSLEDVTGYTADGVPTLDRVRDTIEGRHATALGHEELAQQYSAVRDLEQQETERRDAGSARLEEIRRSLRGD